jgi:hypothetical protein
MQLIPLSHLQEIYICGVINLTHKIVGWLFFKIIFEEYITQLIYRSVYRGFYASYNHARFAPIAVANVH